MNVLDIDHTAIAVRNMDEAIARYIGLFGAEPSFRSGVPEQRVEVAFIQIGGTRLELIMPTDPTSGVARFLDKHGESMHHIGMRVANIQAEIDRLQELGVEMIDREPRHGPHGLIAFIHPRGTGGVLVELVQAADK